eukprot:2280668-Pyramimonas_sp.AAC.1
MFRRLLGERAPDRPRSPLPRRPAHAGEDDEEDHDVDRAVFLQQRIGWLAADGQYQAGPRTSAPSRPPSEAEEAALEDKQVLGVTPSATPARLRKPWMGTAASSSATVATATSAASSRPRRRIAGKMKARMSPARRGGRPAEVTANEEDSSPARRGVRPGYE